jgi:hypothetical protein
MKSQSKRTMPTSRATMKKVDGLPLSRRFPGRRVVRRLIADVS